MNRIILIGNGFDLAHGMKTSYNNFLDDYWENTINKINECRGDEFKNEDLMIKKVPDNFTFETLKKSLSFRGQSMPVFINKFLETITLRSYSQNWVDVENEYYSLLKNSLGRVGSTNYNIEELNKDFRRIQELLEAYLHKIEKTFNNNSIQDFPRIRNRIEKKIYYPIQLREFSEVSVEKFVDSEYKNYKEYVKLSYNSGQGNNLPRQMTQLISSAGRNATKLEIKQRMFKDNALTYFDLIPNRTLFLNFNYTSTERLYDHNIWSKENECIHIHGSVYKEDENPIIFGFGDELDDDYLNIEKTNDNNYLDNIKSIKYLETDNYKKLLQFVNSEEYQIFTMGHSCGVSDRTLLNTLFENKNCSSIKVYYHKKQDGTDNYSDIVKNISRNFNDKKLMRDRVVNKQYCEPLT